MNNKYKKTIFGAIGFFFLASFFNFSPARAETSSGYAYESIAFYAFTTQQTGTIPIHGYYNSTTGDHLCAAISSTPAGYASEGIAFYAYSAQQTGTSAVYRLYNAKTGDHLYTASEEEKNSLIDFTTAIEYL